MQWPSDLWLQLAAVPGSEMLLLFLMNKQHSADLKLIKHMVTKSKENLKPVLTVHVQKCCLGFWSSRSVLRSTPALVTGVWSWTAGSVFPTSSSGGQCMGFFCGLVHSAFCMLFCVRSWQGAEEYTGTQGPGPSEKPGFWKHYFPCVGLVSFASFPGQSSHQDNPVCPSFLPLSTNVNPNGTARRTFWQHQRTEHLQGRALEQEPLTGNLLYAECNNLGGFWVLLVRKHSKETDLGEQKGSNFREEGPKWAVAILPTGWMTVGSGSILLIPNH